jgi:hypothetical protein
MMYILAFLCAISIDNEKHWGCNIALAITAVGFAIVGYLP